MDPCGMEASLLVESRLKSMSWQTWQNPVGLRIHFATFMRRTLIEEYG